MHGPLFPATSLSNLFCPSLPLIFGVCIGVSQYSVVLCHSDHCFGVLGSFSILSACCTYSAPCKIVTLSQRWTFDHGSGGVIKGLTDRQSGLPVMAVMYDAAGDIVTCGDMEDAPGA